ncbi:MAG: LysM peptidoglycan-binding domain-containing protein [Candidatus Saccharibacteria bacterium]|nr:LysM peptidoglycan-binding domain-containing protein [Candidatus Saccharibacteria bacterium]
MTKKKFNFEIIKRIAPYILSAVVVLGVVIVGSADKKKSGTLLNLDVFSNNSTVLTTDQLSELYIVANLADIINLASIDDMASNYVIANVMSDVGQITDGHIEKKPVTDTSNLSRGGIFEYTVQEGETMKDIAARYGLTTDQIRWSNNLKTTAISAGNKLYLSKQPGIVYVVKSSDTIESIAKTYGSNVKEIETLNDLELTGISSGMRIFIKNGTLPVRERPEYVAPTTTYNYSYLGDTSTRKNVENLGYRYGLGGPYVAGQCTQWAWYNRKDLPSNLGNANNWARKAAAAGFPVDHNPRAGDVFQTTAGWYGHVGYVEAVNGDGSIVVTEMNYYYRSFLVIRATIPASAVKNFNYIHKK